MKFIMFEEEWNINPRTVSYGFLYMFILFLFISGFVSALNDSEISRYKYKNLSTMVDNCSNIKSEVADAMNDNYVSEKEYRSIYKQCKLTTEAKINLKNKL